MVGSTPTSSKITCFQIHNESHTKASAFARVDMMAAVAENTSWCGNFFPSTQQQQSNFQISLIRSEIIILLLLLDIPTRQLIHTHVSASIRFLPTYLTNKHITQLCGWVMIARWRCRRLLYCVFLKCQCFIVVLNSPRALYFVNHIRRCRFFYLEKLYFPLVPRRRTHQKHPVVVQWAPWSHARVCPFWFTFPSSFTLAHLLCHQIPHIFDSMHTIVACVRVVAW